jgi:predicted transcriptional regulator
VLADRRRLLAIVIPAAVVFLAASFLLARFLTTENKERSRIYELLQSEASGNPRAVLAELDACDTACAETVRRFLPRLAGPGGVKIARLDSRTSYSVGTKTGPSRVVWVRGVNGRPVVQCVLVRRSGSVLTGRSVSLLRVSAPLANNEDPC